MDQIEPSVERWTAEAAYCSKQKNLFLELKLFHFKFPELNLITGISPELLINLVTQF